MDSKDHVDDRYPLSALTGAIIAAAQEVYNTIGPGFEEKVYSALLRWNCRSRGWNTREKCGLISTTRERL